ncbi:MAG: hypothetical protein GF308_03275 [Candidatus Heimdallarchaeota archaeon]|nr:hypothetical protein [Candidatus Heimdallarchaeota archaeon]
MQESSALEFQLSSDKKSLGTVQLRRVLYDANQKDWIKSGDELTVDLLAENSDTLFELRNMRSLDDLKKITWVKDGSEAPKPMIPFFIEDTEAGKKVVIAMDFTSLEKELYKAFDVKNPIVENKETEQSVTIPMADQKVQSVIKQIKSKIIKAANRHADVKAVFGQDGITDQALDFFGPSTAINELERSINIDKKLNEIRKVRNKDDDFNDKELRYLNPWGNKLFETNPGLLSGIVAGIGVGAGAFAFRVIRSFYQVTSRKTIGNVFYKAINIGTIGTSAYITGFMLPCMALSAKVLRNMVTTAKTLYKSMYGAMKPGGEGLAHVALEAWNKVCNKVFIAFHNLKEEFHQVTANWNKRGIIPERIANTKLAKITYFTAYKVGTYVGNFGFQSAASLPGQLKSQMWMAPLIEFATYRGYQRVFAENLKTMVVNETGSITYRGDIVETYRLDNQTLSDLPEEEIKQRNKTRYREGLLYAIWCWVTDYLEIGGDAWELINGDAVGVQLAKQSCGMASVYAEDSLSVAKAFHALIELNGGNIPEWMNNYTRWLSHPSWKNFWKACLYAAGATISVVTELAEKGFMMAFTGGIAGVYSSMLLGYLVQEAYSGLYRSVAQNSWKNNYVNRLSSQQFRRGDPGYDDRPFRFRPMEYIAGTPEKYKAFIAMAYIGVSLILCWGVVSAAGSTTALVSLGFMATLSIVTAVVLVVAGGVYLALKKYGVIKEKEVVIDQTYGDPPES